MDNRDHQEKERAHDTRKTFGTPRKRRSHGGKHRKEVRKEGRKEKGSGGALRGYLNATNITLIIVLAALVVFNEFAVGAVSGRTDGPVLSFGSASTQLLGNVDFSASRSTEQTIALVFPVKEIKTQEDAVSMIIPTGTPEYSTLFGGVSFDDPVGSLTKLSRMYPGLLAKVKREQPEAYKRFMNLVSKPIGIDCQYCCGVGLVGVDRNGNSACGCQHNPAILSITLGLISSGKYTDAQVVHEALNWKALFFPKDMVAAAMRAAGGQGLQSGDLQDMVGGC